MTRPQRVAVTGMGCISAAAPDLRGHAAVLERPAVHCAPVPAWLFPTTLPWPKSLNHMPYAESPMPKRFPKPDGASMVFRAELVPRMP